MRRKAKEAHNCRRQVKNFSEHNIYVPFEPKPLEQAIRDVLIAIRL